MAMIAVPDFDGFEAFYGKPSTEVFVLNGYGDGLLEGDPSYSYQICYRKIKPHRIVFEEVRRSRIIYRGEFYRGVMGKMFCINEDQHVFEMEEIIYRVVEE